MGYKASERSASPAPQVSGGDIYAWPRTPGNLVVLFHLPTGAFPGLGTLGAKPGRSRGTGMEVPRLCARPASCCWTLLVPQCTPCYVEGVSAPASLSPRASLSGRWGSWKRNCWAKRQACFCCDGSATSPRRAVPTSPPREGVSSAP